MRFERGSRDWWKKHLAAQGIEVVEAERFGDPECSLRFEVVETEASGL